MIKMLARHGMSPSEKHKETESEASNRLEKTLTANRCKIKVTKSLN